MARNSSGTYSLPSGNPVVSGTVISATWANPTMTDISTEITSSLDRNGRGGMLAKLGLIDGTVSAPALTFSDELGSGIYRIGVNNVGFSIGGARIADLNASGLLLGSGARINAILDEDTMSSDSATAGATQQSIKAFVEARYDPTNVTITGGTIDGVVIGGTTPAAGSFTTLDASSSANTQGLIAHGVDTTGATGDGMEVLLSGGVGILQAYDRTGSQYLPVNLSGSALTLQTNGTTTALTLDSSQNATFAGNIALSSGNGIDFSATSDAGGMTSELLDDYEEGSFTAVMTDGTNNATSSVNDGRYTKVGNVVHFQLYIITTSLGSVSGDIRISGLPFAASSTCYSGCSAGYGAGLSISAGQNVGGYIVINSTYIQLQLWSQATGTINMHSTQWTADGALMMTGTYNV